MTAHEATRKVGPARMTGPRHITYTCSSGDFTITDTGDEAKRQWLRHELRAGDAVSSS